MSARTPLPTPEVTSAPDSAPEKPSPPSWWVEGFSSHLREEQARMRRERLPKGVQDYFDSALRAEEEELLLRKRR